MQEEKLIERELEKVGISKFKLYNKLTSDLPINCIAAVVLVIVCTRTSGLPEHNKSSLGRHEIMSCLKTQKTEVLKPLCAAIPLLTTWGKHITRKFMSQT